MRNIVWDLIKVGTLLVLTLPLVFGQRADRQRINYGPPSQIAQVKDPAIVESSGIAASRKLPGVIWTHNDSGDKARVFALDNNGSTLAEIILNGVRARDWEDMASFKTNGRSRLLVGDVGDNNSKREDCTIHIFDEPGLKAGKVIRGKAKNLQSIKFKYADGPHNCEAIAVDVVKMKIYVATKAVGSCKVYELPWPENGPRDKLVAKPIASLKMSLVTAMDISPDGTRAILLTYGHAFEYVRTPGETWSEGFNNGGRLVKMPRRDQGESVCYGLGEKNLFLTSECKGKDAEKNPSPLWIVPARIE